MQRVARKQYRCNWYFGILCGDPFHVFTNNHDNIHLHKFNEHVISCFTQTHSQNANRLFSMVSETNIFRKLILHKHHFVDQTSSIKIETITLLQNPSHFVDVVHTFSPLFTYPYLIYILLLTTDISAPYSIMANALSHRSICVLFHNVHQIAHLLTSPPGPS